MADPSPPITSSPQDAAIMLTRALEAASEAAKRGESSVPVLFKRAYDMFFRAGYRGLVLAELHGYMAESYNGRGDYATALKYAEQAIADSKRLDCSDARVAGFLASLEKFRASTFSRLGRTTEAIAAYALALPLFNYTGDKMGVISTNISIAYEFSDTGKFEEGLRFLQQAEALLTDSTLARKEVAVESFRVLFCRGNLLQRQLRHDEALLSYLAAHEAQARRFGADSCEAAHLLVCVAGAYSNVRQMDAAVARFKNAAAIFERHGKTSSTDYAFLLHSYGCALAAQGKDEEALALFQRALALRHHLLPAAHPDNAATLSNIHIMLRSLGRPVEASMALSEAVAVTRRLQTHCSGPSCSRKLREDGAPLDVCIKCRRTFYCNKACQTADWFREGGHKAECKALRKEATE